MCLGLTLSYQQLDSSKEVRVTARCGDYEYSSQTFLNFKRLQSNFHLSAWTWRLNIWNLFISFVEWEETLVTRLELAEESRDLLSAKTDKTLEIISAHFSIANLEPPEMISTRGKEGREILRLETLRTTIKRNEAEEQEKCLNFFFYFHSFSSSQRKNNSQATCYFIFHRRTA